MAVTSALFHSTSLGLDPRLREAPAEYFSSPVRRKAEDSKRR